MGFPCDGEKRCLGEKWSRGVGRELLLAGCPWWMAKPPSVFKICPKSPVPPLPSTLRRNPSHTLNQVPHWATYLQLPWPDGAGHHPQGAQLLLTRQEGSKAGSSSLSPAHPWRGARSGAGARCQVGGRKHSSPPSPDSRGSPRCRGARCDSSAACGRL